MREIALHVLDLMQNSLEAQARNIWLTVCLEREKGLLSVEVEDDGQGMSAAMVKQVLDPFYTTRKTRKVGLGLALLAANVRACGGDLAVESVEGKGTKVTALFKPTHLDCPPLGDLSSTLITFFSTTVGVNFFYKYSCGSQSFCFNTKEFQEKLGQVPLQDRQVLAWLSAYLKGKERELQK